MILMSPIGRWQWRVGLRSRDTISNRDVGKTKNNRHKRDRQIRSRSMDKTGPFTDSQLILWRMAVVAFAAKEGSQVNWWGREANTVLCCMIHDPYAYRDDCSSTVTCSNTIEGILRLGHSDRSRQEKERKERNQRKKYSPG